MKIREENNLINENKLNKYLHNWFSANCDFDLDFKLSTDFQYEYVTDTVYYAFVIPDKHDRLFLDVCKEIDSELVNCDNFLLSLFHEVGHYITQGDFDDATWEDYDAKSGWGADYNGYYHHPIEYEATKAGIKLMMKHKAKIPSFLTNIQNYEREILNEFGYELC